MSDTNDRNVFNKMIQNALLEFSVSNEAEDIEIDLPMPRVFISKGVQFLINYFNAKELVSTIGYALLAEQAYDEDGDTPGNLVWFFETDHKLPFPIGTAGAYHPEWADVVEYYNDGFSSKERPFYSESVNTPELAKVDKLVLCSNFTGKGYYIYLPNEAPAPDVAVKNEPPQFMEIPAESSAEIPF